MLAYNGWCWRSLLMEHVCTHKVLCPMNCVVVLFLTVKRQLEIDEDLSCVVDFWGKSRVRCH